MRSSMFRSNPIIINATNGAYDVSGTGTVTKAGVNRKTMFMLFLSIAAVFFMNVIVLGNGTTAQVEKYYPYMGISAILMFGLMIKTMFTEIGPIGSCLYAIASGITMSYLLLFADVVSELTGYNIIPQAVLASGVIIFVVITLYNVGVLRPTERLRSIAFAGSISLMIIFLLSFIFSSAGNALFGLTPMSLLMSLLIIALGCIYLVIDLGNIDMCAESGAPKQYEWILALGLFVTLIWIFKEVVSLLIKLALMFGDNR